MSTNTLENMTGLLALAQMMPTSPKGPRGTDVGVFDRPPGRKKKKRKTKIARASRRKNRR